MCGQTHSPAPSLRPAVGAGRCFCCVCGMLCEWLGFSQPSPVFASCRAHCASRFLARVFLGDSTRLRGPRGDNARVGSLASAPTKSMHLDCNLNDAVHRVDVCIRGLPRAIRSRRVPRRYRGGEVIPCNIELFEQNRHACAVVDSFFRPFNLAPLRTVAGVKPVRALRGVGAISVDLLH